MALSFERIPSNIRVPLFYAEVSNREASYLQLLQPALLIGPMLATGNATPQEPVLVTDTAQGYALFGAGSILGDMVALYRRNDSFGTLWAIPHLDPDGASAATASDTIEGVATAAGTLAVYIGGDRYALTVAAGHDAATIAATIAAAVNADPFALVIAAAGDAAPPVGGDPPGNGDALALGQATGSTGRRGPPAPRAVAPRAGGSTVTYTTKNQGVVANELVRTINFRGAAGGEIMPPGITITGSNGSNFAGGAGLPDLGPVIAAMGDEEYDFICNPHTDGGSLDALGEEMNDVTGRWAWNRQIYGHVFCARSDTAQQLLEFGRTRNDPHVSVLGFSRSPTVSWRRAAALTAQAASSLRIDPARPLQTLILVGAMAPKRGDRFRLADSNTLLYNGVATEMESGGAVAIQRCVTTYRVNVWNQPDPSYLDVQTPATLQFIIRYLRNRILTKFPRHKLADDGTPFGLGQAIVTPRIIRAELVAAYSELISLGITENMDLFKQFLIVERDQTDPNRVNVLLPPDLVNQLRIFAMLVEFRLQYSPTAARGGKDTANMIPLLRKFGITLADIKAGDIAAMLPKIATGFQKNTNELTRNAMATALFGKSGAALINFLSQGGEEMAKLGAEAVKLGIITNREAEDANTAGDQWQKFQRAMTAVRNTLAAELLPVIQPVVLALTKWIAANRDWLRTKIHDAVIALSAGVRQLRDAVLWVVGAMGGWRNTLIALGLLINAKLIGSLLGLGLAIGKLALSALALNPLTLAIAGLVAGAYLVYRNWGTIGPWFERQMNAVKGVFEQSGAAVRDWARTSAASIKTAFETGGTMAGITAIGEALKTAFSGVFQYIRDGLVNIDWAVLGDQIRNIDWAAIGYATSQAIVAAFKAGLNLVEWLAELDWEAVGAAAGRLLVLGIAGTFKAMFEIGKWLIGLDWGAITLAIVGFFDSLVRTFFDIGARLLKGLIDGMIDAIPGLRRVTDAVSAAFSLPGQLGQRLFGAGPAAAPATAGGPNLLQQSAAAAPAQRSEIEQRLKVDLAPELRASLTSERTSGAPVRSEVEIGRSMAPAWGAA